MNVNQIIAMLQAGKKPVVKLTDFLWDDSWGEKGMIAEITKMQNSPHNMTRLTFNYDRFKDTNLPLQSHDYFLTEGKLGTAFESGLMKPDCIEETVYFDDNQDVPVVLTADSPIMAEYIKSGFTGSYVEWLEKQLEELVPDCMKTWKEGL